MGKKIILSSVLVLVLLTASVYFIFNDEVRIDIQKTRSIFRVYEDGEWVISGIEYVNVFDGTKKMRAKNRSLETIVGDSITTVTRIANYKEGISTIEIYTFDYTASKVELFPISHSIQVLNAEGKILQYEVQKLLYTGETVWDVESPQSFGHKMEIEWEDGNYYSRIWKYVDKDEGKLTVKYRINSSNYNKNVRLFDPDITVTLNAPEDGYLSPLTIVSFNCSADVTGGATLTNISLWTNETGDWEIKNTTSSNHFHEVDMPSTSLGTLKSGIIINVTEDFTIKKAYIHPSVTATIGYLINDTSGSSLRSNSIVGNEVDLTYNLKAGQIYRIAVDSGGASFTIAYTNVNSFPITVDKFIWADSIEEPGEGKVFSITGLKKSLDEIQIFQRTITEPTFWSCQACDSDGDCGFAVENRTVDYDSYSPKVKIVYPIAINYTINVSNLKFTAIDDLPFACWYSMDGGATNYSNVPYSENFTDVISDWNENTWTVFCNDTVGNVGQDSITFNKEIIIYADNSDAINISANFTIKDNIFVNVSIYPLGGSNLTFVLWNTTGTYNITTYLDNTSNILNWTDLPRGMYWYNVTVCDLSNVCNTTDNRNYGVENTNLSLESGFSNINVELGTGVMINATNNLGIVCVDIDHPDYGINYFCDNFSLGFDWIIDYFRKNILNNSLTFTVLEFIGTEIKEVYFSGHQYDEVVGMSFNISGISNGGYPENIQINNSNTSIIDRWFPGFLIGDYIYQNVTADEYTFKNLTYSFDSSQTIYFWMDRNVTLKNMIFNITGKEFGFDYLDEFDNYLNIDTILTTAQLDPSGVIMPKNSSNQFSYYDTYDSSINSTLWIEAVSSVETGINSETGSYIQSAVIYPESGDASFSNHVAYIHTNISYLNLYSSNDISFRVVSSFYGDKWDDDALAGNSEIYLGETKIWTSSYLDVSDNAGVKTSEADLDFKTSKVNSSHWRVQISGVETSTQQDYSGCNDRPASAVWNWTSGVSTITCNNAGDGGPYIGTLNNDFYSLVDYEVDVIKALSRGTKGFESELDYIKTQLYPIYKDLYSRSNSTVISNSIYDASGDITKATMTATGFAGVDTAIYLYMSADNGVNWESVDTGVEHSFSNTGKHLRWRVDFNLSSTDMADVAAITSINISTPRGYPSNISIDFGNDGIADWERTAELNDSNSPIEVEINMSLVDLTSVLSGAAYYGNNLMRVPLEITSSIGQIDVYDINLTYDPNPVFLNKDAIQTYLNSSNGFTDFPISIESINGNITIDDIRFDYKGGNDTIEILAHNVGYTLNQSLNITVYHSSFNKLLPYTWVDDIFFMPITNSSKNVTPYGQTSSIPIYNLTTTNYGGNMNLSIKMNESFSCLNITWNAIGSTKPPGNKLNTSWQEIKTNLGYLNNTNIWLWADFDNCDASNQRILQPYFYVEGYCVDCIWG